MTGTVAGKTEVARPAHLGLRANLPQFLTPVGVNALVGGMVGQEPTVLPLLRNGFGLRRSRRP
jgi:hypothetical protein